MTGQDKLEVIEFIQDHTLLKEVILEAEKIMVECFPKDRLELYYDDGVDASGESPDEPRIQLIAWTKGSVEDAMENMSKADDMWMDHLVFGFDPPLKNTRQIPWGDIRQIFNMSVSFESDLEGQTKE